MATGEGRPKIVLADDHPSMLRKVSLLLQDKYDIVGTATDGAQALHIVQEVNPRIVVLDIAMPVMNGLQAARYLRSREHPCGIVFLTIQQDSDYILAAQELKASYVFKGRMNSDLLLALEETLAGRTFVSSLSPIKDKSKLATS